jgi:hypothetical protein
MSLHDMKNPTGGVNMRHIIDCPTQTITRLRPGRFCEPHSADPHAMWRGEGERKLPLTRLDFKLFGN